jgi:hypothetical protein
MNYQPEVKKPIGFVSWEGPTVAELWGVNLWRVTVNGKLDPILTNNIREIYRDRLVYRGPSEGYYGYRILVDLAEQMKGRMVFNPHPPIPADAIP